MSHFMKALSILALSACALAAPVASTPAAAYACKSTPLQTVGIKMLRPQASKQAKQIWTAQAKSKFGLSWSVWQIAADKDGDCVKLANNQWRCLVSAKPCNYVVP